MKKGDLTVIFARYGEGPAKKYTLSRNLLFALILSGSVLGSAFALTGLHYFSMWKQTTHFVSLQAEVDQLRHENESFRVSARQLTDQLGLVEMTARKLEVMAGFYQDGIGGSGGPTTDARPALELDTPLDLKRHFRSLNRRRISLQAELSKLQNYYTSRQILRAASPSIWPVVGYPSDRYGWRRDPFNGKRDWHPGIDISAPSGAIVRASADGTVRMAGRNGSYGRLVVVDHRFGLSTRYGHLSKITVKKGQEVRKGDIVGYVGSTGRATGSHVHFEVRLNQDTLDPLHFLRD